MIVLIGVWRLPALCDDHKKVGPLGWAALDLRPMSNETLWTYQHNVPSQPPIEACAEPAY